MTQSKSWDQCRNPVGCDGFVYFQVQEILSDNAFFRVEKHQVITEAGEVIQDWMWTEVPDMVGNLCWD